MCSHCRRNGIGEKVKKKQSLTCRCGHKLYLTDKQIQSCNHVCPACGSPVGDCHLPSAADTQMVNIKDMARMAQEGIEVTVSGEWDTTLSNSQPKEKK